jgi:hypothetical protein
MFKFMGFTFIVKDNKNILHMSMAQAIAYKKTMCTLHNSVSDPH